ncbi:MAG: pseudouridine synthase [Myxococcota bacterium]
MRLVKLIANLGYGSRKEIQKAIRNGWVTDRDGTRLAPDSKAPHEDILFDDEPLDPAPGMVLLMNKPLGYTCSTKDSGPLVYDLLPERFSLRKPRVSSVGRLDKETSGALLFTDDGSFLHKVTSPKSKVGKAYEVMLDRPLRGDEGTVFASGEMMLESETKPLKPASLEILSEQHVHLTLYEGRYHQVRRMFAATGNRVVTLSRIRLGGLELDGLDEAAWKLLTQEEKARIFAGQK